MLVLLFVVISCCQSRRVVMVKDSPRTGRQFNIDVDGNHIIIKKSSNTNIYISVDSARVDSIKIN